jgi:hypothetical protein
MQHARCWLQASMGGAAAAGDMSYVNLVLVCLRGMGHGGVMESWVYTGEWHDELNLGNMRKGYGEGGGVEMSTSPFSLRRFRTSNLKPPKPRPCSAPP